MMLQQIHFDEGGLERPEVIALLQQHLDEMYAQTPAESVHALNLDALKGEGIWYYSAWNEASLVGCGAFQRLDDKHAEIKSMRIHDHYRGQGCGALLLAYLVEQARGCGYVQVSLETGSSKYFEPARKLYENHGFEYCPPFGNYVPDELSVFMTRSLGPLDLRP